MIMIAHKFSLLRELLWAATLAIGFGTLWFALALWLGTSIQQARGGKSPPQEDLVVKSNGTPLIRSIPRENLSLTTYRDLNGRAQDAPDRNDLITSIYMPGEHGTPGFFFSRLGWEERLRVFINEREPTVNWFFVHDGKPSWCGRTRFGARRRSTAFRGEEDGWSNPNHGICRRVLYMCHPETSCEWSTLPRGR
jgi:hypothetical protein